MILAATVPPLFQHHHDVCWLDIPVDQIPFVNRAQSSSQLRRDFERQLYFQSTGALDEIPKRFSLDKLHRIEVTSSSSAQVQYRGNV